MASSEWCKSTTQATTYVQTHTNIPLYKRLRTIVSYTQRDIIFNNLMACIRIEYVVVALFMGVVGALWRPRRRWNVLSVVGQEIPLAPHRNSTGTGTDDANQRAEPAFCPNLNLVPRATEENTQNVVVGRIETPFKLLRFLVENLREALMTFAFNSSSRRTLTRSI